MDSPRSSGFKIAVRRMSFGSSSVQVLRMAPGSEGATGTSLAKREC